MSKILTYFDDLPLYSICNGDKYLLYQKGTGLTLKNVLKNIDEVKNNIDGEFFINDFKSHLKHFNLPFNVDYAGYDLGNIKLPSEKFNKLAPAIRPRPEKWRNIVLNASVVYQFLENRGVNYGYKKAYPRYSLDTMTGRSKTLEFNIQGMPKNDVLRPVSSDHEYFVHFDWSSADIAMAAYMSKDEKLMDWCRSDVYEHLSSIFCRSRGDCKKSLLYAFYSLNFDHEILNVLPGIRGWMKNKLEEVRSNNYSESFMGRRFTGEKELGVFNAQFQGSVVHAMQNSLIRVFGDFKDNLLTEIHDSLVFTTGRSRLKDIIYDVSFIMSRPFSDDLVIPVVVSVGKSWKGWRVFKTIGGDK
jgi:hypothetical protein